MAEDQALAKRELPEAVVKRGIDEAQWNTLCRSLYPGANPNSVLLVVDYCKVRKLDPMKKPCHIVPMQVFDAKSRQYEWRDVILPGIYEYRTTAQRTGEYLGHSEPEYGATAEIAGVSAPEWCAMTIFRWNPEARLKVEFPVKVFFSEVVATKKDKETGEFRANARWTKAPRQMLTKCAEAAGLREAFPEELGGEPTAEEIEGQRSIEGVVVESVTPPAPSPFEAVSEPLRDRIEKAFQALGFSPGQRTVKIQEFLGMAGVDADAAAETLLEWCKAEYRRRQEAPPPPADNSEKPNAKPVKKVAPAPPAATAPEGEEIFDAPTTRGGELF